LKADALDSPTRREAVADLLADITDAARAIGVIVQQATHGTETRGRWRQFLEHARRGT
jgi:hypothetical protein